jgi:hypothetical protein
VVLIVGAGMGCGSGDSGFSIGDTFYVLRGGRAGEAKRQLIAENRARIYPENCYNTGLPGAIDKDARCEVRGSPPGSRVGTVVLKADINGAQEVVYPKLEKNGLT